MSSDAESGSWRKFPLGTLSEQGADPNAPPIIVESQEPQKPIPTVSESLVRVFRCFQESSFGKASSITAIYYPSCERDVSIVSGFPDAHVIFADINEGAMCDLKEAGHDARTQDATAWVPDDEMDLVLLLNPGINPHVPSRAVRRGGYILGNNYSGTADILKDDPEFTFMGAIRGGNQPQLDTDSLNEYWQDIETEDEFKRARFSFLCVDYMTAQAVVREVFGTDENVLEHYKELLERGRKQSEGENEVPGIVSFTHNDTTHILSTDLPRKEGTADDIFIFQRKETEDTRPEYIKAAEVGKGNVVVDGEVYPYTILDRKLEPRLPGFMGFPRGEQLFISDETPVAYRRHLLAHEVREFTQFAGQEGRCLASLQKELAEIPEEMRAVYITYRRKFFGNLIAFYAEAEDEAFKREIQASYDYLQSI